MVRFYWKDASKLFSQIFKSYWYTTFKEYVLCSFFQLSAFQSDGLMTTQIHTQVTKTTCLSRSGAEMKSPLNSL